LMDVLRELHAGVPVLRPLHEIGRANMEISREFGGHP
jgi:hypothetical protein